MPRVAIVTGANKGLGYAIVRNLALRYPASKFSTGSLTLYLTARDIARGEDALSRVRADAHVRAQGVLKIDGGPVDIQFLRLDVASSDSIQELCTAFHRRHPEGLDLLVNNAGISSDHLNPESTDQILQCNYFGTLRMMEGFLHRMKADGRIVNIASLVGKLNKYSSSLVSAFHDATEPEHITKLMEQFKKAVENGSTEAEGWPPTAYGVSKAGVIGVTGIIARQAKREGQSLLINSCCPGYIRTDLTKHKGRKTPDQGAKTPLFLALEDLEGRTGEFWQYEAVSQW